MRKRIWVMAFFILVGMALGFAYMPTFWMLVGIAPQTWANNIISNVLIGAIIFWVLSLVLRGFVVTLLNRAEAYLTHQSPTYLLFGSLLTIVGLVLALLISTFFFRFNLFLLNTIVPLILMVTFAYFGFRLGTTRLNEWRSLLQFRSRKQPEEPGDGVGTGDVLEKQVTDDNYHHYKILDTNILIDGRIYDLVKTGFVEGTLLVPNFVLYELQYIADSSDSVKRVRGRRGLDILNKLQSEKVVPVEMYEGDFEDLNEVDNKLIRLAKEVDGVIVTNDYNLNKVIQFQNVQVLNINSLANAMKPRVIPGEDLRVMIVKNGTERQQGVAYLDDGTMVVVEDGRYYLNDTIDVTVTSALQTDAGRMIFAKPSHSQRPIEDGK